MGLHCCDNVLSKMFIPPIVENLRVLSCNRPKRRNLYFQWTEWAKAIGISAAETYLSCIMLSTIGRDAVFTVR